MIPATPIVAWYDQRGDVELIAKELPELVARTGVRFDPVATIFKLPELLRRGDAARWLNLAEWVVRQLGGDEVAEMSLAGRTGLCDLHTGDMVARRPRVPRRRRLVPAGRATARCRRGGTGDVPTDRRCLPGRRRARPPGRRLRRRRHRAGMPVRIVGHGRRPHAHGAGTDRHRHRRSPPRISARPWVARSSSTS